MQLIIRDPKEGTNINLVLPYGLGVNLCIRKIWFQWAISSRKSSKTTELENWRTYLNKVDFGELRHAFHQLKYMKGLTLVEVASKDGVYVKISV